MDSWSIQFNISDHSNRDCEGNLRLRSSALQPDLKLNLSSRQAAVVRQTPASFWNSFGTAATVEGAAVSVGRVPACFLERETNEIQRGRASVYAKLTEALIAELVERTVEQGLLDRRSLPAAVRRVLNSIACHSNELRRRYVGSFRSRGFLFFSLQMPSSLETVCRRTSASFWRGPWANAGCRSSAPTDDPSWPLSCDWRIWTLWRVMLPSADRVIFICGLSLKPNRSMTLPSKTKVRLREPVFLARGRFSECKAMWPAQACHQFFFQNWKERGPKNKKNIFLWFVRKYHFFLSSFEKYEQWF